MEAGLEEACTQIRDKKYEEGVLDDGYMGVRSYGICFCKKSCIIGKYQERFEFLLMEGCFSQLIRVRSAVPQNVLLFFAVVNERKGKRKQEHEKKKVE